MFRKQAAIPFAIIGIVTTIGFIVGVAPGYFIKGYALFGIGAGFFLIVFTLLIIIALVYEYLYTDSSTSSSSYRIRIFHESLSRKQKIILSSTSGILFSGGAIFGILWGLLFKVIRVSAAAHIIITAIFIIILLVVLVIILVVELKKFGKSKLNHQPELQLSVINEPKPSRTILKKSQEGPKNTAARANRYRAPFVDDNTKSSRPNSSVISSTDTFRTSKPPSTIQLEYQRLLRPPSRFNINDRVYANDNDLAEIIDVDDLGNYQIRYIANGLTTHRTGAELRKTFL